LKVGEKLRLLVKILLADKSQITQPKDEQAYRPAGKNPTNKMRPGTVFGKKDQNSAPEGRCSRLCINTAKLF
jgi:hypothetical protein